MSTGPRRGEMKAVRAIRRRVPPIRELLIDSLKVFCVLRKVENELGLPTREGVEESARCSTYPPFS